MAYFPYVTFVSVVSSMTSRFPPFAFVEFVSPYNKKNITRWLEDMNFMFSMQEQYLTRSRYCSCHSNIKFISSRHRVISSIYQEEHLIVLCLRISTYASENQLLLTISSRKISFKEIIYYLQHLGIFLFLSFSYPVYCHHHHLLLPQARFGSYLKKC